VTRRWLSGRAPVHGWRGGEVRSRPRPVLRHFWCSIEKLLCVQTVHSGVTWQQVPRFDWRPQKQKNTRLWDLSVIWFGVAAVDDDFRSLHHEVPEVQCRLVRVMLSTCV